MTDIEQALAEIKRRATREDLWLYNNEGKIEHCICIREDALQEVLAEAFARIASQEPTE